MLRLVSTAAAVSPDRGTPRLHIPLPRRLRQRRPTALPTLAAHRGWWRLLFGR